MNSTTQNRLRSGLLGISGAGLGAASMYFSDPDRGRYRRAIVRDRLIHWKNRAIRRSRVASLDLAHRTRGQFAELRGRLEQRNVSDDVLVARVASHLGRLISAPHPIELTAENRTVIMGGPIFEDEIDEVLHGVSQVPGVKQIVNKMQVKSRTDRDPPKRSTNFRKQWPPSTKLLISLGSTLFSATAGWIVYRNRNEASAADIESLAA